MLDSFGVTEDNWQDALEQAPDFAKSETPFYIGRAVVALATDERVGERTGHALSAGYLAREYGFTDVDGRQPPGYFPEGMFQKGYFVPVHDAAVDEQSWGRYLCSLVAKRDGQGPNQV